MAPNWAAKAEKTQVEIIIRWRISCQEFSPNFFVETKKFPRVIENLFLRRWEAKNEALGDARVEEEEFVTTLRGQLLRLKNKTWNEISRIRGELNREESL